MARRLLSASAMLGSFALRVLRLRLVQFGLLGGAIFAATGRGQKDPSTIVLSGSELDAMRDLEAGRRGAGRANAGVAAEVQERALEDEILYREGLKLGFDKNDAIVRQRVVQKTLFLAEELAGASATPTDEELRRFYDATRAQWNQPERFHFVHVYARDRARLEALRAEVIARAGRGEPTAAFGDPSPVPAEANLTREQIAGFLGDSFASALSAQGAAFGEPLPSGIGWHLVRVLEHVPSRPSTFDEAKDALRGVYAVKKREDAVAAFLVRAFQGYDVEIRGERLTTITPARRLAVRNTGSAED